MEDLIQDLFRLKIEVVARNQVIPDPMVNSVDTVAVTGLSVAVGIYNMLHSVLFGHPREDTLLFHDICWRIVEKHNIFTEAGLSGAFKRNPQSFRFPRYQLFGLFLIGFIPSDNLPF